MRHTIAGAGALLAVMCWGFAAGAEDTVEQRIGRLEEEVGRLSGTTRADIADGASEAGRLSWHGYGELHYNNPGGSGVPDDADAAIMDFHRMVWGLSYQFNDRISLHTEVDFEHAATEIELEFAYLDFLLTPAFNLRAGSMLMPVGPLNEFHEPPLFYSVERPYVQRTIIPTSWQEGGAGIFGSVPAGLKYRVYLVSGLNAEEFSAANGIRDGRGHVAEAPSEDLAVVGRVEYVGIPGLELGASFYQGGANVTKNPQWNRQVSASGRVTSGSARRASTCAASSRRSRSTGPTKSVPRPARRSERRWWDGMWKAPTTCCGFWRVDRTRRWWRSSATRTLTPRNRSRPGSSPNPANDRQVRTAGLAYYPIPDIAIKGDVGELEEWDRRLRQPLQSGGGLSVLNGDASPAVDREREQPQAGRNDARRSRPSGSRRFSPKPGMTFIPGFFFTGLACRLRGVLKEKFHAELRATALQDQASDSQNHKPEAPRHGRTKGADDAEN